MPRLKLHAVWMLLFAATVSGVGCDANAPPERYREDRSRLSRAFAAFSRANELTQVPAGQTSFKATPEHDAQVIESLRLGLAAGDSVSDSFLDWLHPDMRAHFRRRFMAGQRLYLEGLSEENLGKQRRGIELIAEWYDQFWSRHSTLIADKAFGT